MPTRRLTAFLTAVACALALGACGIGAGESSDGVSLLVTRDFGSKTVGESGPEQTTGEDTIMRLLQRGYDVDTRYGGGFVQAIDGLAGGREAGRPVDWFFYVNGIEADRGATSTKVHDGDRIWWDRRDWGGAQRVPAVVGSYPEPFLHGLGGKRWTTRVECPRNGDKRPCDEIAQRLGEVGTVAAQSLFGAEGGDENLRVLVGPWNRLRHDRAGRLLDEGPQGSGVYARFSADGRQLQLLDGEGRVVRTVGPGSGLIAATRFEDQPPTWIVTGTDDAGVAAAVQAFDEGVLSKRFAVAVADDRSIPLPVEVRGRR